LNKKIIEKLVAEYKTNNPLEIANKLNIETLKYPLHKKIKGMFVYSSKIKKKYLIANSSLNKVMQKVVYAHELGHAILHPHICRYFINHNTLFSENRFEKEANIFAAELLIKSKKINRFILEKYSVDMIAYELNLPKRLIEIKINNMKKMDHNFF